MHQIYTECMQWKMALRSLFSKIFFAVQFCKSVATLVSQACQNVLSSSLAINWPSKRRKSHVMTPWLTPLLSFGQNWWQMSLWHALRVKLIRPFTTCLLHTRQQKGASTATVVRLAGIYMMRRVHWFPANSPPFLFLLLSRQLLFASFQFDQETRGKIDNFLPCLQYVFISPS